MKGDDDMEVLKGFYKEKDSNEQDFGFMEVYNVVDSKGNSIHLGNYL